MQNHSFDMFIDMFEFDICLDLTLDCYIFIDMFDICLDLTLDIDMIDMPRRNTRLLFHR